MAAGRGDAKSLVDVVAYRNADALLHVVRAFRDPSVPHPQATIDPVRDARIDRRRTDPRRSRRRRAPARAARKRSEEESRRRSRSRAGRCSCAARADARRRHARCARSGSRATTRGGCAAFSSCPPSRCCVVVNLDEARRRAWPRTRPQRRASTALLAETRRGGRRRVREDRARDRAARRRPTRSAFLADLGLAAVGPRSRDSRGVRPARLHLVLHRRRGRMPRVVDSARHAGAGSGRRDSLRHPARLHPRRSRAVRHAARARIARRVPRSRRAAARRQGVHRRSTAT